MKGNQFKIILEDFNEKFDKLIEGQNLLSGNLGSGSYYPS